MTELSMSGEGKGPEIQIYSETLKSGGAPVGRHAPVPRLRSKLCQRQALAATRLSASTVITKATKDPIDRLIDSPNQPDLPPPPRHVLIVTATTYGERAGELGRAGRGIGKRSRRCDQAGVIARSQHY